MNVQNRRRLHFLIWRFGVRLDALMAGPDCDFERVLFMRQRAIDLETRVLDRLFGHSLAAGDERVN